MTSRSPRVTPLEAAALTPDAASEGLAVVSRDAAAGALSDPTRRAVLSHLQSPGSATTVAKAVGLSRQLANYHVRSLERAGLVEEVSRRQRRGLTERVVRATAAHYVLSPDALGTLGVEADRAADRFSATYQVAVAARTIRDVAELADGARRSGKRLTTLTLDTAVRFATPAARQAFADDLVHTINGLVTKYHDETAPDGRTYRLFLGAHPEVQRTEDPARRTP